MNDEIKHIQFDYAEQWTLDSAMNWMATTNTGADCTCMSSLSISVIVCL